jgi:hypothetical protein
MNLKQLKAKIRYGTQYLPFTMNTVLWAAAVWLCYRLLYTKPERNAVEDTDSFRALVLLMGKVALWFVLALVFLSIISTFLSWLYYLWLRKKKDYRLQVHFTTEQRKGRKNRLYLDARLQGVYRPLLGFVQGRLFYDDYRMTDKFPLLSNQRGQRGLRREAISGRSRLLLPDIREYQLRDSFVFFEDMLHLISLPVRQPLSGQFYQPPVLTTAEDREVAPKQAETPDVRIDQLRRMEGEYLNYKDFEAGDDVRRIVWKVYARSGELVVRIPERFEPYASHLYFYASFEAGGARRWTDEGYLREMLNYYKNRVWTVYDTLARKEWELRYIPDQKFAVPEELSPAEKTARLISNSVWQRELPVDRYFNPSRGAVLCISSLTDPDALRSLLSRCDEQTVVYFVKLSSTFRHPLVWGWLRRLIFLPPKDRLSRLRTQWTFSPARFQLQKKEKEMEALLRNSNVRAGIL